MRADAGVLKPRSGASWPAWSGQRRRAAVAADTQRVGSAGGRSLNGFVQFVQLSQPSLTTCFAIELTPYAKRFSDFFQNQSGSPKYHLQMLFNDLVLILNQNKVTSSQSRARQAVSVYDLAKMLSVEMFVFADSCDPNTSMLGAKSINDPKIKVVPYTKHYNFALVTTSIQGL